jgi:hypothetical protein
MKKISPLDDRNKRTQKAIGRNHSGDQFWAKSEPCPAKARLTGFYKERIHSILQIPVLHSLGVSSTLTW